MKIFKQIFMKTDLKNPKAQFSIFFPTELINQHHLKMCLDFLHDKAVFKPEYNFMLLKGTKGYEVIFQNPLQVFEFGRLFAMIENSKAINKGNSNLLE